MKEKIALSLSLLMMSIIIVASIAPVRAFDVNNYSWVEPDYIGEDEYYENDVIGYLAGTYWNFTFSITNDASDPLNISAIRAYFDWGKNYTYTYATPMQMMPSTTQVLSLYNVTPPITEVSELWTYEYWIYVDYANSSTSPYQIMGKYQVVHGHYFAILSQDHLDCLRLWRKLSNIDGFGSGLGQVSVLYGPPEITKVYIMMQKAYMEYALGTEIFQTGVFSEAKTHLQNAETMYDEALDTWDQRGTAIEDAELNQTMALTNYYNAQADAERKSADASLVNAYGWLLFGLGWTFIGLGAIVYGMRKPKVAQS